MTALPEIPPPASEDRAAPALAAVPDAVPSTAPEAPGALPEPEAPHAPGLLWYLTEPTRAVVDLGQYAAARQLLRAAPSGDGHTVIVLPGLGGADGSTAVLRRFLSGLGYDVRGWGLGRNLGPSAATVDGTRALLERVAAERGEVSLVGWSLGGVFARELARERPELVRQVITLGSPYALRDARCTRVNPVFRLLSVFYEAVSDLPPPESERPAMPVPATSVYSRSDGIVPWRACLEEEGRRRESVPVASSHLGYCHNTSVLWLVADRLAQPRGRWHRFAPPPGMARMFPAA
ncbi:esterase/lipase family protein [Actinosynnema pretiosum]|uniref:Alpha/beta hydrolase n=1 Tax=Actinosynnema pretiosum TaxID=42197 RepID=A0A290Z345_9PSEU|nr:alpha/beta hydrolase [Actinosynnema pretiosum]ATE53373.1 alpha/beta hydrolase [Actinosynnema pretiosum]